MWIYNWKKNTPKFYKGRRGSAWDRSCFLTRTSTVEMQLLLFTEIGEVDRYSLEEENEFHLHLSDLGTVFSTCSCPADRNPVLKMRRSALEQDIGVICLCIMKITGESLISLRLGRGRERGLDEEGKWKKLQRPENKKYFAETKVR